MSLYLHLVGELLAHHALNLATLYVYEVDIGLAGRVRVY